MTTENPLYSVVTEMAAESLEQMTQNQQEFSKRMAEQHQAVDNSANRIVERLALRRPQGQQMKKYTPEVIQIADFLTAFPKLVPVVQTVIQRVTTAMEQAFDSVAAKYDVPPPQGGGTPNA